MTDYDLLVHRLVGGWAIDYKVPMTELALSVIERRLVAELADAYAAGRRDGIEKAAQKASELFIRNDDDVGAEFGTAEIRALIE